MSADKIPEVEGNTHTHPPASRDLCTAAPKTYTPGPYPLAAMFGSGSNRDVSGVSSWLCVEGHLFIYKALVIVCCMTIY